MIETKKGTHPFVDVLRTMVTPSGEGVRPLLVAAWLGLASCAVAEEPPAPVLPAAPEAVLQVTDLVAGIGDEALPGMIVIVHYTGWLHDSSAADGRGRKFDSSRDRGQPLSFPLGAGHVIRGWEQGVPGMKVGGVRRLLIPPALGYGGRSVGNGVIPPNSTLLFEIELLALESVTLAPQSE
jgi:FKBP-type peptidyl-prolyl cis-trans isomerase FkpA